MIGKSSTPRSFALGRSPTASDHVDKRNTFSVTLVDRSDIQPGDFDIIFYYGALNWDTGDASGGVDGLAGTSGYPARAGYSNGSGEQGTYYELSGSGQANGLLGSGKRVRTILI